MIISPSIASSDVLYVADEVDFADKYFDDIHIDIEDGVAVSGISFGFKMAKKICERASKPKSIHLEVINPMNYIDDVKQCNADICFIQVDILENPLSVVNEFKKAGINVGIALGDRDINKDYDQLYKSVEQVLISTACHDDPMQEYQQFLEDYGLMLNKKYGHKVWLDGGVNYSIYQKLKDSPIYAMVMGRAVYADKQLALKQYRPDLEI